MAYRAQMNRDRWKAMTAAVAATGLLGAGVIAGLHVNIVTAVVKGLQTFNVELPKPPPPPPPPKAQPHSAKREQGAPAKAAQPKPVVAPKPVVRLPAEQSAPTMAGNGTANTAGAGTAGNGTGAGGSGNGPGGGGSGGFTPARKITKIPDSQYRRLSAFGSSSGRVGVSIKVEADGSVSTCRVVSSSGIPAADSLMCQLTQQYVRFSPARDPSGRAIAAQVTFFPDWHHR